MRVFAFLMVTVIVTSLQSRASASEAIPCDDPRIIATSTTGTDDPSVCYDRAAENAAQLRANAKFMQRAQVLIDQWKCVMALNVGGAYSPDESAPK